MVGEQIEKFAVAKDKAVRPQAGKSVTDAAKAGPPAPFDVAKFAGIFAAIGLALGAIGTAIASIVGGFMSLPVYGDAAGHRRRRADCLGPVRVLIAFLQLRQRNLGRSSTFQRLER